MKKLTLALAVGALVVMVSTVLGVLVGLLAGYVRRSVLPGRVECTDLSHDRRDIVGGLAHRLRPKGRAQNIAVTGLTAKGIGKIGKAMHHGKSNSGTSSSPDSPLEIR